MVLEALDISAFKGGAGIDVALRRVLDQLRGALFLPVASGVGGIATGVKGTLTLSDASNPTVRVDALYPGQHGNNIRIKTVRSTIDTNAFDLEVYYPNNTTLVEKFGTVSHVNSHARYMNTVINTGLGGQGGSKWIRVADLASATVGEQRPVNAGPTVLTTGAGEFTLTGVKRGDHIAACINITTAAAPVAVPAGTIYAVDTDKIAVDAASAVAASQGLLFIVLPKAA